MKVHDDDSDENDDDEDDNNNAVQQKRDMKMDRQEKIQRIKRRHSMSWYDTRKESMLQVGNAGNSKCQERKSKKVDHEDMRARHSMNVSGKRGSR